MTLTGKETKRELMAIAKDCGVVVNDKMTNAMIVKEIKDGARSDSEPEGFAVKDEVETEVIDLPKVEDVAKDEIPGEVLDPNGIVIVKNTSHLEDVVWDAERTIKVVVTDHDNTQQIEDDEEGRMFSATWGNMMCQPRNEKVLVTGMPTAMSMGMKKHMESLKIPTFITGPDGKPKTVIKPRFTINEVDGWTQEQLDEIAKKQRAAL